MTIAEKILRAKTDYDEVYAAGQAAGGGENLWQYVTTLDKTFQFMAFPDGYELTVNVPNLYSGVNIGSVIAYSTGVKKITLKCGQEGIKFRSYLSFGSCQSIEEVDLSQFSNTEVVKVADANRMFYASPRLHTITGVLDFTGCANLINAFSNTSSLINVEILAGSIGGNFAMVHSPNLSDASIQSIIDGLADLTGGTAQTLTLHATVGAKLTEVQKAAITAKNRILVY